MLEEIQVAQPLDLGIVHRMFARRIGVSKMAAGNEIHLDRQLPLRFVKIDTLDKPGRLDTQCRCKQLVGHHSS